MHYMIDLETLATEPKAVITSIGVSEFDLTPGSNTLREFYDRLDVADQTNLGRTLSSDTVRWWNTQDPLVFVESLKGPLVPADTNYNVLVKLATFFKRTSDIYVWGNGSSFDITLLESLFKDYKIPVPWSHFNVLDYRTFKKFIGRNQTYLRPVTAHNALEDAKAQARFVIQCLK